ncbi:hypothetical protein H0G72_06025, partial [Liberibacter sp. Z1]|nr:hypothetical protein [Candidatus Liberibacter sp.]
ATKAIKTHADMMKSSAQLQSMKAVSDMSSTDGTSRPLTEEEESKTWSCVGSS